MKKLISMLLVLTLILSIVPVASAAGMPFTDVPEKSWYTQYVQYVYDNNLMNGVSEIEFAPGAFMTRGMVVTVLYRAAGEPAVSGTHPFTDIPSGKWYEAPAIWGYQNSIVTGMTDTTFEPNRNVTREMLVALFFRYAVGSGDGISETTNLSAFEDSGQIRNYAKEAFSWAVANGIVNGKDATHLDPSGNATRAECATMLQRLFVWMGKEDGSEEPEPTKPTDPSEPSTPTEPSEPTNPTEPSEPSQPTDPSEPDSPSDPISGIPESHPDGTTYVLNTNTHKFHETGCRHTNKIDAENYHVYVGTRDELIAYGYSPCGTCDP